MKTICLTIDLENLENLYSNLYSTVHLERLY